MKLKIAISFTTAIGPRSHHCAVNILKTVAEFGGHDFTFVPLLVGGVAIDATGSPLPTATLEAALECDAVLMGAVGDNKFNALPPDKAPEATCSRYARRSAVLPTPGSSFYPRSPENSPSAPKSPATPTSFVREPSAASTGRPVVEQGNRSIH